MARHHDLHGRRIAVAFSLAGLVVSIARPAPVGWRFILRTGAGHLDTTRPSLLMRVRDRANNAAWAEFDAIYRPMLYRFVRTRGLQHAEAEDLVQHCHVGDRAAARR